MRVVLVKSGFRDYHFRLDRAATSLTKRKHEVTLLIGHKGKNGNVSIEQNENYTLYRYYSKSSGITILFFTIKWWFFIGRWLMKNNYDVVQPSDFETLVPCFIVSKIKRKRIVYDIADFYIESLPQYIPNIIKNILRLCEKFMVARVDAIFLPNVDMKDKISRDDFKIIMNTPIPLQYVIDNEQTSTDNFIIFFAGQLDIYRGFENIIKAIDGIHDIKLIVAGPEPTDDLKEIFSKSKNVEFIGYIHPDDVIQRTLSCNLIFALYDPILIPNNMYASPNKLFEAMMCGKPILVSAGTTMANIVRESNCGIVVDYDNINEIKDAIITLQNNPELQKKLGDAGRRAFETKYNWNIMEQRLLKTYDDLTCQKQKM